MLTGRRALMCVNSQECAMSDTLQFVVDLTEKGLSGTLLDKLKSAGFSHRWERDIPGGRGQVHLCACWSL